MVEYLDGAFRVFYFKNHIIHSKMITGHTKKNVKLYAQKFLSGQNCERDSIKPHNINHVFIINHEIIF